MRMDHTKISPHQKDLQEIKIDLIKCNQMFATCNKNPVKQLKLNFRKKIHVSL